MNHAEHSQFNIPTREDLAERITHLEGHKGDPLAKEALAHLRHPDTTALVRENGGRGWGDMSHEIGVKLAQFVKGNQPAMLSYMLAAKVREAEMAATMLRLDKRPDDVKMKASLYSLHMEDDLIRLASGIARTSHHYSDNKKSESLRALGHAVGAVVNPSRLSEVSGHTLREIEDNLSRQANDKGSSERNRMIFNWGLLRLRAFKDTKG